MTVRPIRRRTLLKGVAAAGAYGILPRPAVMASDRARTLRLVPDGDLSVLDPLFSTSQPTQVHGYHVYDTLFARDAQGMPQPQMAESYDVSPDGRAWSIRLREGLRFHDGTPVLARDCVASLRRWSARDGLGQFLAKAADEWVAVDDRTLRISLRRPFPRLPLALSKPSWAVPFIMPAHVAATDPTGRITDFTGSGPYRFKADEQVAGSRVVYERFDRYQPRQEPASYTAGGKVAHFDRIEWVIMPDPATASAALMKGEVDWWEQAQTDLLPMLRGSRDVVVQVADPGGQLSVMRFNCLQSPFKDVGMRRAIAASVQQQDYLDAAVGSQPGASRICQSLFPCMSQSVEEAYGGVLNGPRDLEAARSAIRAAGHEGERLVVLNASDSGIVRPYGEITTSLLSRLGFHAELVETDFNTMIRRRNNNKGPVSDGGWSVFHTWWSGVTIDNPVTNILLRGLGEDGYAGWYRSERMEERVGRWLDAATAADERQAADEVLKEAMDQLPTIPLGMTFVFTAFRKDLSGVLPGVAPFPWNVKRG
jgi:peptide/nickel transport system substrate-binding protein